jgi:HEAT repeat protein
MKKEALYVLPGFLIVSAVVVIGNWNDLRIRWMRKSSVPELVQVLQDPKENQTVRRSAAIFLGDRGAAAKEAIPALGEALRDEFMVEMEAIQALGKIGTPEAVPALARELQGASEVTREAALRALRKIGPAAAGAVPTLLDRYSFLGGEKVRQTLARIDPRLEITIAALPDLVRSPSPDTRLQAAAVLGDLGREHDQQVRPLLLELLRDGQEAVRKAAQLALKKRGLSAEGGELSAEADEPKLLAKQAGDAYAKYHQALEAKHLQEALKYVPKEKSKQLEGLPRDEVYKKLLALSPLRIVSVSGKALPDDRLSLTVEGRLEKVGLQATGSVLMLLEDGQWKVLEERWNLH